MFIPRVNNPFHNKFLLDHEEATSMQTAIQLILVTILLVLLMTGVDAQQANSWYVYKDIVSPENHGEWTNFMPKQGGEMIRLNMASPRDNGTAVSIDIQFKDLNWCGIAVASCVDCWGKTKPTVVYKDLINAKKLVFLARGEQGNEVISVKVAITGREKWGDSAISPAEKRLLLSNEWQSYELDLRGVDLSHVITPFAVFAERAYNGDAAKIRVYLDDIRFEF